METGIQQKEMDRYEYPWGRWIYIRYLFFKNGLLRVSDMIFLAVFLRFTTIGLTKFFKRMLIK